MSEIVKEIEEPESSSDSEIEVKPKKQTMEPEKKKRVTKQYIQEVVTWGVNQAKWKAATEYCLDRGWQFMLMTEDHLGL